MALLRVNRRRHLERENGVCLTPSSLTVSTWVTWLFLVKTKLVNMENISLLKIEATN